jgi:hypothetical protein
MPARPLQNQVLAKGAAIMRLAALTLAAGIATAAGSVSANATPVLPNLNDQASSNIVLVRDGCGRGFHANWRGFCVPNYRPYAYRPYYRPYTYYRPYAYYGGGYYRPHRYWYGY